MNMVILRRRKRPKQTENLLNKLVAKLQILDFKTYKAKVSFKILFEYCQIKQITMQSRYFYQSLELFVSFKFSY